jgi:hypothetical protein
MWRQGFSVSLALHIATAKSRLAIFNTDYVPSSLSNRCIQLDVI